MAELQVISNHTTSDKIEFQHFDLPQNYSILINKLERLALGLDSALGNFSLDRQELEIAVSGTGDVTGELLNNPIAAGRAPPPQHGHNPHSVDVNEVEYTRVVSDIWIGVVLTLLIVSVVFFICSCFLYHKFQQWKNSYRTNHRNEPTEICRHYASDFEAESLPSYTIVSGLPSYDDALEEFRKAGIILTPPIPVIKIFETDSKENQIYNMENGITDNNGDNVSVSSGCTCGANNNTTSNTNTGTNLLASHLSSTSNLGLMHTTLSPIMSQVIELTPEQLEALSKKRLSLQIAFNNSSVRHGSRPRIDLCREVNRNNMLRSRAAGLDMLPQLHRLNRSSSSTSLNNEQIAIDRRLQQHRGSLY